MKKPILIGIYAAAYVLVPYYILTHALIKYGNIIGSNVPAYTVAYLTVIFFLSVLQLFIRWRSLPAAGMLIATALYTRIVLSNLKIRYGNAVISVDLSNFLILIYAMMIAKVLLVLKDDMKKIATQESKEHRRAPHYHRH